MRILIVEDEPLCAQSLKIDLEQLLPQAQIVGITGLLSQAAALIQTLNPDLVFLDVHLEDGQGTQLFQHLPPDFVPNFHIVFTTAYDKYAIRAFQMGAIHYLLKPIIETELQEALLRVKQHPINNNQPALLQEITQAKEPDKIAIVSLKSTLLLAIKDIIYVEADSSYTTFHLINNKTHIAAKNLKYFEELLPADSFARIHEKHLVNCSFIQKYIHGRGGEVLLQDGTILKVAARRKDVLLQYIQHLL